MSSPKASIVYASLTGSNEEIAFLLSEELEELGAVTEIVEVTNLVAEEFLESDICIMTTYSYESGDEILPDETLKLYNDLANLNLSGKTYGVLGSGQTFYDQYCGAVDKFDLQFEKTKAWQGSAPLKIEWEIDTPDDEDRLKEFAEGLIKSFNRSRKKPKKTASLH